MTPKGSFNNYVYKRDWVGGQSNVCMGCIGQNSKKRVAKCLLLSTRGRWVVKKAQNSVNVVNE